MSELITPLVSIAIPIVKTDFLEEALNCALTQSYQNIEIIVLNNGKTKETRHSIKQMVVAFRDSRIKYFENEDQLPIIENWNKTISHSSGTLYSLLSDDDIWDKNFISEIVSLSNKYPQCKVFHTRATMIDQFGKRIKLVPLCNEFEEGLDFIWHRLEGYRYQFLSDFAANRQALLDIGGFTKLPYAWGSDDITWFKLACSNGIAYSSKPLFSYRSSEINTTNTMGLKQKLTANEKYIRFVYEICQNCGGDELLKSQINKTLYTNLYSKNRHTFVSFLNRYFFSHLITNFLVYIFYKPFFMVKYNHLKVLK
jgi:glycosyltransferase involved in cell wall biosynthesis